MEPQNLDNFENNEYILGLNIKTAKIQDYYMLNCQYNLNPAFSDYFIPQKFILFILQIRSIVNQRGLQVLKNSILTFCQEALQKKSFDFGFVINGEYFTIKKANYEAIKQILNTNVKISYEDNYLFTLRKLRHIFQNEIYKYDKKVENVEMIFFTSSIQIDHKLGIKKRSYIDHLNQHSKQCMKEVLKIKDILYQNMKNFNSHIIALQKNGYQQEEYSLCDRDLFNQIHTILGNSQSLVFFLEIKNKSNEILGQFQTINHSSIQNTSSFTKLYQAFKSLSTAILAIQLVFQIYIPIKQIQIKQNRKLSSKRYNQILQFLQIQKQKQKGRKYKRYCIRTDNANIYQGTYRILILKQQIDLNAIALGQIKLECQTIKKKMKAQQLQNKINHSLTFQFTQLSISEEIFCKMYIYDFQLTDICQRLKQQIIKIKRIYDGNNKTHLQMIIDQQKQQKLKNKLYYIEQKAKQIYSQIFDTDKFPSNNQKQCKLKRISFQKYSALKRKIDISHEVLMNIHKRQIKNDIIGKISAAVTFWNLKNSIKNKLIRRINLNPKMIDQTYVKIHDITSKNDYTSLQTLNKNAKHAISNCIKSNINFATALRKQDCLAILIQVQRPDSAIVDPGRIKIRQISPFAISVSNFFNIYQYGIDTLGQFDQNKGQSWFRQYANLQKSNYKQMWDYWNLIEEKQTFPALIPVYLCEQHWQIAKLLMKPCLGWTATGQPLGYIFSQIQNIPFMALSFSIRRVQQLKYQIMDLQKNISQGKYKITQYSQTQRQLLQKKILLKRMSDLCWILQQTCKKIVNDLSSNNFQQKMSQNVIKKYQNYLKNPLERTIDIISNNSAFLAQLYCIFKLQILYPKPSQNQFHQFFKRLVQQQLRRQSDGWNQEQAQDKFINKLLNSQIQKMNVAEYVIVESEYYDNFIMLQKGQTMQKTYFQIKRNELQMMLKKNGMFNDTQKMLLIQYKRLYQNKVLWMWFIRFKLYEEIDRIKIYKWKCIDLTNSYQLFTMIIQNKKQRKNYKRRQAIIKNQYVDPFIYQKARQFLELQFIRLRANKEKNNIQILNNKKYNSAAATFTQTKSLQEAAGTLINFDIGKIQCNTFYRQMTKGNGIRMQQKLKMLLLGQFKNLKLFNGWKMNKQKNRILREKYPQIYMKYGYMF